MRGAEPESVNTGQKPCISYGVCYDRSRRRGLSKLIPGLSAGRKPSSSRLVRADGEPTRANDSNPAIPVIPLALLSTFHHFPQVPLPVSTYSSFRKNPAALGYQLFLLAPQLSCHSTRSASPHVAMPEPLTGDERFQLQKKLVKFKQALKKFKVTMAMVGRN